MLKNTNNKLKNYKNKREKILTQMEKIQEELKKVEDAIEKAEYEEITGILKENNLTIEELVDFFNENLKETKGEENEFDKEV